MKWLPVILMCVTFVHDLAVPGKTPLMALLYTEKEVMSTKAPMLSGRVPLSPLSHNILSEWWRGLAGAVQRARAGAGAGVALRSGGGGGA